MTSSQAASRFKIENGVGSDLVSYHRVLALSLSQAGHSSY